MKSKSVENPNYTSANVKYCEYMTPISTFDDSGPTAKNAIYSVTEDLPFDFTKLLEDSYFEK